MFLISHCVAASGTCTRIALVLGMLYEGLPPQFLIMRGTNSEEACVALSQIHTSVMLLIRNIIVENDSIVDYLNAISSG